MGQLEFCSLYFNMLCGRGYNEFVDYSLMAIKLNSLLKSDPIPFIEYDNGSNIIVEIVRHLLLDDRHDCYQNIPYLLNDIAKNIKDEGYNPIELLWAKVAIILIECFNVHGNKDLHSIAYNIPE